MDGRVNAAGLNFGQRNPSPAAPGQWVDMVIPGEELKNDVSTSGDKQFNLEIRSIDTTIADVRHLLFRVIVCHGGTTDKQWGEMVTPVTVSNGTVRAGNAIAKGVITKVAPYASSNDVLCIPFVCPQARMTATVEVMRQVYSPDQVQPGVDMSITNPGVLV